MAETDLKVMESGPGIGGGKNNFLIVSYTHLNPI